jgi:excisionase family DNA binding protein
VKYLYFSKYKNRMKEVSPMSLDDRLLLSSSLEDEMLVGSDEPSALPSFLLTVDQVAPLLGLSRSQVYKLIKTEHLPVVRIDSKIRFSPLAIEQWIEEHLYTWEEGTWLRETQKPEPPSPKRKGRSPGPERLASLSSRHTSTAKENKQQVQDGKPGQNRNARR